MTYQITGDWAALSVLTNIPIGKPMILSNAGRAGDIIEVIISDIQPSISDRGVPVKQLDSQYRIAGQSKEAWVRYIRYDLNGTITPTKTCLLSVQDASLILEADAFSNDLIDGDRYGSRGIKASLVDIAYEEGRKFRAFYDFTGKTLPVVLKFVITKSIDLTLSVQEVHDGAMRYRVFTGGVEGGTFTPIASLRVNNKTGVPIVDSGISISVGGTLDITGQEPNDIVYIRTSGASGQTSTVTDSAVSSRGFPPTVAYVVIDQIPGGNKPPSGVAKYEWIVN